MLLRRGVASVRSETWLQFGRYQQLREDSYMDNHMDGGMEKPAYMYDHSISESLRLIEDSLWGRNCLPTARRY